jgi:hypothetical protein
MCDKAMNGNENGWHFSHCIWTVLRIVYHGNGDITIAIDVDDDYNGCTIRTA